MSGGAGDRSVVKEEQGSEGKQGLPSELTEGRGDSNPTGCSKETECSRNVCLLNGPELKKNHLWLLTLASAVNQGNYPKSES